MKIAGYSHLSTLDVKYLYGQTELLTMSNLKIQADGKNLWDGLTLVSEDTLFGAADEVGPLEKGKTYQFDVSTPTRNVEYVLVGDTIVWVAQAWEYDNKPTFVWRADQDGVIKVTFLRHRKKAHELLAQHGEFKVRDSLDTRGQSGEYPEISEPLRMSLMIGVSFKEAPDSEPTSLGTMQISGIRRWMSPRIYAQADSFSRAERQVTPLPLPEYPTDHVSVMENHDMYMQGNDVSPTETIESRVELFSGFGVDTFTYDGRIIDTLGELKRQGKFDSLRHVVFGPASMWGIPAWQMMDPIHQQRMLDTIDHICEVLPDVEVWIRPGEINTNGEWQVNGLVPDYMSDKEAQGREAYWARRRFAREYHKMTEHFRTHLKHPQQIRWVMQGDGFLPGGSDYYRYGFESVSGKSIHRTGVQMVTASARGMARAFDKPIALAYDCWNAGGYCNADAVEVEHIFRSYYWAGCDFVDYEAQFVGTEDGRTILFNEAGRAFYDWVNLTRVHPRRGKQIVPIGFMKGSDDLGIRPSSIGGNRSLLVNHLLQHDHPALLDWNLSDLVFPEWGNYEATNYARYLTGTPHGAMDVVPWDAPAEHLKTFGFIVMIGKNRVTPENLEHYLDYVKGGGTMVLALEHMLGEDQYTAKYAGGVEELIGCRLGADEAIGERRYNKLVPSRPRFFNHVTDITGEVVETLDDGAPYVVRTKLGEGTVFFYTAEYFGTCGRQSIDKLLNQLLSDSWVVRLDKDNGWIEQAIFTRDGIGILSLMNHGRVKGPIQIGPDQGPLETEVVIDLANAGLEIDQPEVLEVDENLETSPVAFTVDATRVSFHTTIEKFSEFVIGPEGRTKQLLFS